MVTKEIAYSPLGRAVWDLSYRLAIRQGVMAAGECTHLNEEPAQEDEFISPYQAAKQKGTTPPAIHATIKRVNWPRTKKKMADGKCLYGVWNNMNQTLSSRLHRKRRAEMPSF